MRGITCRVGFQPADIPGVMCNLTLQVGKADPIEIYNAQGAHPGSGEVEDNRTAQAPRPDDEDPCVQKLCLTDSAHFAQHDVPSITFQLLVVQGHGCPLNM